MSGVEEVLNLLPAYVADDLDAETRERVEHALEFSPRLRDELARYQRLMVLLAALAQEEVTMPRGAERRMLTVLALNWYLGGAARLVEGLAGAYGRALLHYLGGGPSGMRQLGGG